MGYFRPKLDFSLKRSLLWLNREMDVIKYQVSNSSTYGFYYNHSHSISMPKLSNLERMILFYEDRRFFSHNGVEIRSFFRTWKRFARGKGFGGVSTIDQQVVRIITQRRERTATRKIRELILALAINTHISKKEIFYCYIHDSYFGHRLIGCEIAAQFIFRLPAANLSIEQAAFLASLLPLPLPKFVYTLIEKNTFGIDFDPQLIIDHPIVKKSRWGPRIEYRYKLASGNYDFMPKSLRNK
ncbi:MAG: transglycosylase domain-containing protein [Rhodobacteraceae bacterium]|nr:transglycosylase domain-containing protein [Paracoccaceae bacterium]